MSCTGDYYLLLQEMLAKQPDGRSLSICTSHRNNSSAARIDRDPMPAQIKLRFTSLRFAVFCNNSSPSYHHSMFYRSPIVNCLLRNPPLRTFNDIPQSLSMPQSLPVSQQTVHHACRARSDPFILGRLVFISNDRTHFLWHARIISSDLSRPIYLDRYKVESESHVGSLRAEWPCIQKQEPLRSINVLPNQAELASLPPWPQKALQAFAASWRDEGTLRLL